MKRLISFFLIGSTWLLWWGFLPGAMAISKPGSVSTPYVNGIFHALIIGNNEYKDPEGLWVSLKTPINDAEAVASLLRKKYGFDPKNIILIKNATRADILSAFSKLAKICKANDSIFIYYAGHGYSDPDTKEAFWIPVDAVGKEDYTFVRNSTIKSKLTVAADHARHVFLISDSCFSGALLREGHRGLKLSEKTDQYYQKVAEKKSVQILAAGGLEYVDDNYKETGHSPFTYFLIKQLEQSTDRYFSASELSLEVTKSVSKNVFQTPEKGVLHGAGDNSGEFFFVKAETPPPPAPKTEAAPAAATEKFDAEAEMWALVKDSGNIDDIHSFLAAFPKGQLTPVAQLKLKQLERTQQRGGKQTADTGQASAAVSKKTPNAPGLSLALFPGKFRNSGKRAYGRSLKVISKMVDKSEQFQTIFSYYPLEMNRDFTFISQDLVTKSLWEKGTLFSAPKPKIDAVAGAAKKLGVDAVLMYYLDAEKRGSTMIVYAIDVEKKAQYLAREPDAQWRVDGQRITNSLTRQVFKAYFQNRKAP
jgi:hypothetical protein